MEGTRKDKELVKLSQGGDEEAFLELVERYTDKVQRLAMRITRNPQDTDEVVQDVFVTLFTKLRSFQGKSAFSSWLYRVTANAAFMKLRTRRKHSAASYEEMSANGGVVESFRTRSDTSDTNYLTVRHELRALLEEAMEALPKEYRTIFILRDVDGMSNQEAGEILNLSVPAVKSRLHRARLMLRKKLQRYYQDYYNADYIQYGRDYFSSTKESAAKAA